MRARLPLLCMAGLVCFGSFASPVRAEPVRAVVELFTSQGCSSCPPADAHLGDLARQSGVIVVTLPVDYWDYLGWKDTLASPVFSKRQRMYAKERGDGQVYTPQTVINGASHQIGSDKGAITKATPPGSLPVAMSVEQTAAGQEIRIPATTGTIWTGSLWLIPVTRREQVVIARGENRGRTITYTNVARDMIRLGDWKGEAMSVPIPAEPLAATRADGFIVLMHGEGSKLGKIIGAVASPGLVAPGS